LETNNYLKLSGNLESFNISDFIQAPASDLNATINLSGKLSPQISGVLKYTIQKSRLAKFPVTGTGQIAFNGFEQFKGKAELSVGSNHFLAQGGIGELGDVFSISSECAITRTNWIGLGG